MAGEALTQFWGMDRLGHLDRIDDPEAWYWGDETFID
jgi:hypothetical protein